MPSLPAAAVLSFIKQTRGLSGWKSRDLAESLNVGAAEARRITALLQVQGYIERAERDDQWLTTVSGDTVSGSKPPRYKPEAVESALSSLVQRIKAANQDRSAPFRVAGAVAFGDFLSSRARLQAPDVGVDLIGRSAGGGEAKSATEQAARREFLKELKSTGSILNVMPLEPWMAFVKHRKLL